VRDAFSFSIIICYIYFNLYLYWICFRGTASSTEWSWWSKYWNRKLRVAFLEIYWDQVSIMGYFEKNKICEKYRRASN